MSELVLLPNVQLSDLLLRLGHNEQHVHAQTSTTANGWGTMVAWNPAASYVANQNGASQLEDFAEEQHTQQRLMIGYLSYDFGCLQHKVVLNTDDDTPIPLIAAAAFDNWLQFDATGATIHTADSSFVQTVRHILARPMRSLPTQAYRQALAPAQSRQEYTQAYTRAKDYIEAGDIYQVNLAHQLVGSTDANGRDLFCLLSKTSQADFQAYIEGDGFEILSYSPERFIRIADQRISTFPIKGTRPRGATSAEDAALQAALRTSPKDRAELDMITDLMRNDLGAICQIGTVQVTSRRIVTSYPTLWHAHSVIEGTLRQDISGIGALMSLMPGGSITGCPKKRAMEIIDELETKRRGIYTGSIFAVQPNGQLDSTIAIRTLLKKGSQLYLSVGGGIVYDSIEADEYQESLDKATAFLKI